MSRDDLLAEFESLPSEEQRRVADYIRELGKKSKSANLAPKGRNSLSKLKFVGMWRSRADMKDSTRWVRDTRKKEWRD